MAGPSRSGPVTGPSRGGPIAGPHITHHDGPRFIEPSRRPTVLPGFGPQYRLLHRLRTTPMPIILGVSGVDVQRALAERGYYNGPIDGEIGPMSRNAIAAFQSDAGLTPTGEINNSLLRALDL